MATENFDDCVLIRALNKKDWELCRTLLRRKHSAHFAQYRSHNRSALEFACLYNAPLDVVAATSRELMEGGDDDESKDEKRIASPPPPLPSDEYGRTPLHLACAHASEEVIAFLIDVSPVSLTMPQLRIGWLPLNAAIRFRRAPSVIDRLLRSHPVALPTTNRSNDGSDPLAHFFRVWKHDLTRNVARSRGRRGCDFSDLVYGPQSDGRIPGKTIVEGTYRLLAREYSSSDKKLRDVETRNTLHQAVRIKGTPLVFFTFLLKVKPKEAFDQDPEGNFVLHLLCSGKSIHQDCCYDNSDSDEE